jgi:hypothetical protein
MSPRGRALAVLPLVGALLIGAPACQSVDRFDTKGGGAYCGSIVPGQFLRTPCDQGGFQRNLRLRIQIDTDKLTTTPVTITSDDNQNCTGSSGSSCDTTGCGPCAPHATFENAPLRVTQELVNDPLWSMTFEDGQVHNFIGWVDSTCRGTMLGIVSLYKNDRVEARFLRPVPPESGAPERDAFGVFDLSRYDQSCGF